MKTKQVKKGIIFPKGLFHFILSSSSPFYSILLYLFTLVAFFLLPELRISTAQSEKGTHWRQKTKTNNKHQKRKSVALFHTYLHSRGVYRHRGPYFRVLSAGVRGYREHRMNSPLPHSITLPWHLYLPPPSISSQTVFHLSLLVCVCVCVLSACVSMRWTLYTVLCSVRAFIVAHHCLTETQGYCMDDCNFGSDSHKRGSRSFFI